MKLVKDTFNGFEGVHDQAWNDLVEGVDYNIRSRAGHIHRQLNYGPFGTFTDVLIGAVDETR